MTTDPLMDEIKAMTHEELARLWRFGAIGDPRLVGVYAEAVKDRLVELGGMTPGISKRIGW